MHDGTPNTVGGFIERIGDQEIVRGEGCGGVFGREHGDTEIVFGGVA